jgi:hypothetical protein
MAIRQPGLGVEGSYARVGAAGVRFDEGPAGLVDIVSCLAVSRLGGQRLTQHDQPVRTGRQGEEAGDDPEGGQVEDGGAHPKGETEESGHQAGQGATIHAVNVGRLGSGIKC